MKPQKIKLGAHDYTVRPQPIGYLMNSLGPELQAALESQVEGIEGARWLGAKAHEVLRVFIPELMPLHEFLGFASEETMLAKQYEREHDRSPDAPQVKGAFKAVKTVNGGEVLDALKAVLGPAVTQKLSGFILTKVTESGALDEALNSISATSAPSPTSPSTSGESESTSSSPTSPTPTPPESAD